MRSVLVVLVLVGVASSMGCRRRAKPVEYAGRTEDRATEHYNEQRVAALSWARRSTILFQCNGVDSPPSMQGDQHCGTVTAEVWAEDYIQRFIDAACGGVLDEACEKKHSEMFFARLEERYSYANWTAVNRHCKAWPVECGESRNFEFWLNKSHNDAVQAQAGSNLATIQARAEQESQARAQAQAEADERAREENRRRWAAVAAAMRESQSKQTNCTTHYYGNTASTNCTTH